MRYMLNYRIGMRLVLTSNNHKGSFCLYSIIRSRDILLRSISMLSFIKIMLQILNRSYTHFCKKYTESQEKYIKSDIG